MICTIAIGGGPVFADTLSGDEGLRKQTGGVSVNLLYGWPTWWSQMVVDESGHWPHPAASSIVHCPLHKKMSTFF